MATIITATRPRIFTLSEFMDWRRYKGYDAPTLLELSDIIKLFKPLGHTGYYDVEVRLAVRSAGGPGPVDGVDR